MTPKFEEVDPKRSFLMSRVRGKDTKPELLVRRALHRLGYRYTLHSSKLPGRPDLVFPTRRKVIFIHGCFWHRHADCSKTTTPKTRASFWIDKFKANQLRDARAYTALKKQQWRRLIIWECETNKLDRVVAKAVRFLES